ncbi:MAG: rod shape-determining protein RodA [Spirochaetaceae bacterium]|jgi:rod shape determining protein RodA|nr:rod shape-determining protein RodA [Spirochaetaceae bacterium]
MRLKNFLAIDFSLLFSAIILIVFGILFIYSSRVSTSNAAASQEYIKQILWGALGLVLALTLAMINYRRIYYISLYLYIATIVILLYTCIAGREINGARAWIGIGSFGIQPSEFAKITTILLLAQYLDYSKRNTSDLQRFLVVSFIAFLPMLIVLVQPDFGTSLVFIPILLVMTFIAGIQLRYIAFLSLIILFSSLMIVLPFWQEHVIRKSVSLLSLLNDIRFIMVFTAAMVLIFFTALFGFMRFKKKYFYWIDYFALVLLLSAIFSYGAQKVLKPYQINRLVVFIDPNVDPRGAGWNIIQSITAIGSGGVLGKGYLQGTQSHYRFLPQQSTDFIFSIFSEEWGFLGGILLFTLFLTICLRLIKIMKTTKDPFGCYITAGISAMFIFHFLINIGMTMGIMPITGIPLLFMSYGGSSLISAMIGIGLALSVYIRRFQY